MTRSVGAHVHFATRDWTTVFGGFPAGAGRKPDFREVPFRVQQLVASLSELSFRYLVIEAKVRHGSRDLGL